MDSWLQHQDLWVNLWWCWRDKAHSHAWMCELNCTYLCDLHVVSLQESYFKRNPSKSWAQMKLLANMAADLNGFLFFSILFFYCIFHYILRFSCNFSWQCCFSSWRYLAEFQAEADEGVQRLFEKESRSVWVMCAVMRLNVNSLMTLHFPYLLWPTLHRAMYWPACGEKLMCWLTKYK